MCGMAADLTNLRKSPDLPLTACQRRGDALLVSTAILAGLATISLATIKPAHAACSNTAPVTGETVDCTGASSTLVQAGVGQTDVTLNILDGAQLDTGTTTAVFLHSNSTINLRGSGRITTIGNNAFGGYIQGAGGTITLNLTSQIGTAGLNSPAAFINGNLATIDLAGHGSIVTTGDYSDGAQINGLNGQITLNDFATVTTTGKYGNAVVLGGDGGTVILNDHAAVVTAGIAYGLLLQGDQGHIALNDGSTVDTSGSQAHAIGLYGQNGVVTLSGDASITTHGNAASGVNLRGSGNSLILTGNSQIRTTGTAANAVHLSGGSNAVTNDGTLSSAAAPTILGDNNAANVDTILNRGRVYGGGGTAIDLQDGNDQLTLGTGSQITGTIDGGAGTDTLTLTGTGSDANVFAHFESLIVNDQSWSLSGNSTFTNGFLISSGRLAINGTIGVPTGSVLANGILSGTGTVSGVVVSIGTIAPGNSVGTLTINRNLTQTGGAFDIEFDKSGVDRLDVLGLLGATLVNGPTLHVIPLGGASGASGIILHTNSGITGSFGAVTYQGNGAVSLTQTATDISLITVDGTPLVASDAAASETGLDFLEDVAAEQMAGLGDCTDDSCNRRQKSLWARGFGRLAHENARDGNQAFDYRIAGTALGGDMEVGRGLRLGASLGYSNTEDTVSQQAADSDIDTGLAALYADYQHGPFFVTAAFSGGWQSFDLSRQVSGGEADAVTHGWLFGSALQAGAQLRFPQGWKLTPSAGIAYQHQWVDGYAEHGGGASDVTIRRHQADALRLTAQLTLSQDYQLTGYTVTPHAKLGIRQQYNLGGHADGGFSDGSDFTLALQDASRTVGLIGVGADIAFENGLSTFINYDGAFAASGTIHAVTGGLRYSW